MKILQVTPFFSPSFGGSATIPYQLSKWLAIRGHDVTVLTTDFKSDHTYEESLKQVRVVSVHCLVHVGLFLYSPHIDEWLRNNIREYEFIHLHNYRSYQNNIVCKYAKEFSIPYIVQPHGALPCLGELEGLKKLYDIVWGHDILKYAQKIIAVSHIERQQFLEAGIAEEKITIIPNGISIPLIHDLPSVGTFRERYHIQSKYIILFVGRIHKIKGIDFLIRAFSMLVQIWDNDDVALVIVGPDYGYLSVLEHLVQELDLSGRITFVDYLSSVGIAYQDADLLVYPSSYEIFGLVPFEALLYGTSVIVTDDCGCGDIIKEAKCGYLVHYGDVDSLSKKMKYALEHPEENEKMVQAGRQYILENLSWESVVQQVESLYMNCVYG